MSQYYTKNLFAQTKFKEKTYIGCVTELISLTKCILVNPPAVSLYVEQMHLIGITKHIKKLTNLF